MIPHLVIVFPFSPIIFHIGPIDVRWYGLGYAIAFMAGLWLAGRHLNRKGVPERQWGDLAFWSIVLGLIAARLYYDFQSGAGFYLTHPQDILAFWQGGMAYFGGLFTVPVFVLIYCIWRRLPFWTIADAVALFAAIGQPIGRIGNIFNGDILGYASNLPWAIRYTNPATFAPSTTTAYQPANAYELVLGLLILVTILSVRRWARPREGALFLLYAVLYAVLNFCIFFLRSNSVTLFGLKQAQLSSIVLAIVIVGVFFAWRRWPVIGAPPPDGPRTDGGGEDEDESEPAAETSGESGDAKAAPTS